MEPEVSCNKTNGAKVVVWRSARCWGIKEQWVLWFHSRSYLICFPGFEQKIFFIVLNFEFFLGILVGQGGDVSLAWQEKSKAIPILLRGWMWKLEGMRDTVGLAFPPDFCRSFRLRLCLLYNFSTLKWISLNFGDILQSDHKVGGAFQCLYSLGCEQIGLSEKSI